MQTDEKKLLHDTTRHLLESTPGEGVVAALRELGWFDVRVEDPALAEGSFFELQGECLATSGLLDAVVIEALIVEGGAAGVAAAGTEVVLVHPMPGAPVGPGIIDGATLHLDGLLVAPGRPAAVLVPLLAGRGVIVGSPGLEIDGIEGVDPWLGWRRVRGTAALADLDVVGSRGDGGIAVARRALAHELIGLTRHMLGLAVEHVSHRRQFGRPIGSFQAVQHRLADVRVALEVAEQAAAAAWTVPDDLAATMAKILAGTAARTAVKQCQQVMGGMGFTWEHPLHRYIRRALALDALHGSSAALSTAVGARLITDGFVSGLISL